MQHKPAAASSEQTDLWLIQGPIKQAWFEHALLKAADFFPPEALDLVLRAELISQSMMLVRAGPAFSMVQARDLSLQFGVDINPLVCARRWGDFGLIAFDMDSTLITIECIDEMAAYAGCGAEVAAITEAAMRGEICDYDESLRQRVALLGGQSLNVMNRLIAEKLMLNPGVEKLTNLVRSQGLKMVVLSGGFHPIVDKVASMIQADACRANRLGTERDNLNGTLIGPIVNAHRKAQYLKEFATQWGLARQQTIAIGDGANDLAMMAFAGLSASWRAKPLVAQHADLAFLAFGLDAMLQHFEETRSPVLTQALRAIGKAS
jgi:phosphoserine phosphatase